MLSSPVPAENAPSAVACEPCGWALPSLTPVPGSPSSTGWPPGLTGPPGGRARESPCPVEPFLEYRGRQSTLGWTSRPPLRGPHTPRHPRQQPMEQRPAQCWEQAIQLLQRVRAGPELFLPHSRTGGVLTRPPRVSWAPCTSAGCAGRWDPRTWPLPRNVCTVGCGQRVSQMLFQEDCAGKSVFGGLVGGKDSGGPRVWGRKGAGTTGVTRLLGLLCPSASSPCSRTEVAHALC